MSLSRPVDRLAQFVGWGLERGLRILPENLARATGRGLAALAYRPLRIRRSVVERQIAASFPEADREWVQRTARACYRHFGEELTRLAGSATSIEAVLADTLDPGEGTEIIRHAIESSGGAVLVTGHLGNWELAGAYLARAGLPTIAVVQRQRGTERRLRALRERLGLHVAHRDEPPRRLMRALRSGHIVALVADQHARRGGVQLDVLGCPAWTTLGPARLCLAANVPLFLAALVREGPRYRALLHRIALEEEEVSLPREQAAILLTRGWLAALDREIRARPEQYFWFHRRWKRPEQAVRSGNAGSPKTYKSTPGEHAPGKTETPS